MAKIESNFKNMVLTLLIICGVAALALGAIYNLTKKPIEKSKLLKQELAIKNVVPEFEIIKTFKYKPDDGEDSLIINNTYKNSNYVGTAIETYTDKGFGGRVKLMVGFLPNGCIYNIEVLELKETPGLGTKMTEEKFKGQFKNKNPKNFKLIVKKDNGDVDAITAATISSRAFCDAVQRAYNAFVKFGGNE
ncbi:MAG: RnfABCDGE type electron transport complex subunit G [Bacteroidales bacterium]|nr:RnfABCDGE type electron transport complex subunit G [Bacteroidales bacterium]